ncbi:protein kinase domain-containing protein [Frigoriglobus tundricola]|uniref:Protein kinase domain-containing protein n=1 Tax=Frigoriglobus tundricola TaxID=2774151 RepID=A0A6M5YWE4_9BACT|nr:protein kinase [Frigoriglobus tundricola]QJW97716.1 hypothetical protein FTUN_5294 [Frigoriglobus tundricola]
MSTANRVPHPRAATIGPAHDSGPDEGNAPVEDVPAPLVDHPRYQVLERIGEGGMGVVYRAEHRVMGRVVALKVLGSEVTRNPTAVDRFRREVRLAARLHHAHIVTAFDADEAGGLHFLVMEFVDGVSLEKRVRDRGPLPVGLACEYVRQAAVGLQHAHDKGMVHRDIKPHNLMLAASGEIKILDFGLACVAPADGPDPASVTAQVLTRPQTLLGTPDFLSPEQARSTVGVDGRSDIYSLGCTLYFLLTGRPPFDGVGPFAKMIAHVKEPVPDLTAVRPDAPAALADVLRTMMAKAPEDRYQTPDEVIAALRPFTSVPPDPLTGAVPRSTTGRTHATRPSSSRDAVTTELPLATEYASERSTARLPDRASGPARPARRRRLAWAALVVLGVVFAVAGAHLGRLLVRPADKSGAQAAPHPEGGAAESALDGLPIAPPPHAPHVRKKHVLLIVPPDFAAGEYGSVTDVLKHHNLVIKTAAPEKKPLDGFRYGLGGARTHAKVLDPDFSLKEIADGALKSIDAAIVLTGDGSAFGPKGPAGPDFARVIGRLVHQKKVVGAGATGIVALGAHGFLEHAEVAAPPNRSALDKLKVRKWVGDSKVVIDLPFITAGEVLHTRALAEEVARALEHAAH